MAKAITRQLGEGRQRWTLAAGGTGGVLARLFACSAMVALPIGAGAGEWAVSPRLTIGEDYSDNIRLARPGRETDDFVTTITPGVVVSGRGGRTSLDLIYDAQFVHYARDTGVNRLNNQLQAVGNVEVWRDRFFVDVRAGIGQTNIDNTDRATIDNINLNTNRETFYTYTVSPVFRQRFSTFGNAEARYALTQVFEDKTDDSTQQAINAKFESGAEFGRFPWSVAYDQRIIDDQGAPQDEEFREFSGEVGYIFNRQFRFDFLAGYEINDFQTQRSDTDGFVWRASTTWTPSRRTRLRVGFGERFFGNDILVEARHRMRRTTFTASFRERPQTASALVPDAQILELDEEGNLVADTIQRNRGVSLPSLTSDEVFIRKRFQAGVALNGRRTTAELNIFDEKRDFEETGDNEEVYGLEADIVRNLSPKLSVNVSGGWERTDFRAAGRKDDRWDAGIGVSRRFGPSLTGLLAYRYYTRDSNSAGNANDFDENRISATVQMVF